MLSQSESTSSETGLGLYIARGFVEARVGHIPVSELGKGSTFTFTLPKRHEAVSPA